VPSRNSLTLAFGAWLLLFAFAPVARAKPSRVAVVELEGTIQPAALHYVDRALRVAAEKQAELVILELDTPGGTLVSLRSMASAITASKTPVVVYVTPAGARAASAGFFILMAADVGAMAPGTNAGAAHPVALGGEEKEAAPAMKKAVEDTAALVRSLASARGRPVEEAEKAVREARSYSAEEALRHGLIEIVARDRSELLQRLDGRTVRRFDGKNETLDLSPVEVATVPPTFAERVLMVIAHPQVAYLLMMAGLLGLFVELTHPGAVVPGVVGAISFVLALYAFSVLPVNWAGVLLILVGLGLFAAETLVTSYGLFALAGLSSFVLGSLMLVDDPLQGVRLSLELIVPTALVLGGSAVFLLGRALRAGRREARTGAAALVGEVGEVTDGIDGSRREGRVFVHGEYWSAMADDPVERGVRVRVEGVDGLRLRVTPVEQPATERLS
jgi:membrane-bound serine protease (ClpP class)